MNRLMPWIVCLGLLMSGVPMGAQILINELDCDQIGFDTQEFIELYDGGVGVTPLDGYVLVLFTGASDTSYRAVDLDGYVTDSTGFFVIGSLGMGTDIELDPGSQGWLENGPDAAGLYLGNDTDFPNGTAVTAVNLIDAVVYDTDDADDPGLIGVLLNPGQGQINEDEMNTVWTQSIGRCPDGSGGARNTDTFRWDMPSVAFANICATPTPTPTFAPAPICDTEYLNNGDMESWSAHGASGPPDSWTLFGASYITIVAEQDSSPYGSWSTLLTKTAGGSNDIGRFFQVVPSAVLPNTIYTLSAWFYDDDVSGRARMNISWRDGAMQPIGASVYSDYTVDMMTWQELTVSDQSPAGAAFAEVVIRIYDIDEQTVSINVDSVSLMEPCDPVETPTPTPTQTITPTPTTAPCDINIIPNAGFEMWTGMILDIWTPESGIQAVQNTVNVVEGLTSVDLSRTLLGTDLTSAYVPVIGGEVYDAGIQVIDNHPDINARFYVLFYNSAFTYMNSSQWQDTAGQSPDWQVLGTGSILIPASAAWARIRVRFFDDDGTWPGSATGTITIDDSWLIRPCNEPTPTPTVTPTAAATVSIYDIQYSTTGSSPLNGTMVRTQGIVTAAETGNDNVFIQENYAAPWSGLHIHMPTGIGSIQRGDLIIVQGVVAEISGMTSIDNPDSVTIISSGNTLPPPAILAPETLASAITAEAYEGVLAQLQTVMVIDVNSGPGEWDVTNGTGIATVDDMYTYLYAPTLYEMIDWVQGPVSSEAGAYKLQPRDDNDISATFVPLPAVGGWGIGALAAGMGLVLVRRRRQR